MIWSKGTKNNCNVIVRLASLQETLMEMYQILFMKAIK